MSIPAELTAHQAAEAAKLSIQTAANTEFIANADLAIAAAITQSQSQVYLSSVKNMNFKDVFDYFHALGYVIGPTANRPSRSNPASLFGSFWQDFWNNVWNTASFDNNGLPYQIVISWSL